MAKRIRQKEQIYLAPQILGFYENHTPQAYDEKNQELLDPSLLDHKIIIYERQVKEWFLSRATNYKRGDKNGFVILMICFSYLEGVEEYRQGRSSNSRSRQFFKNSLNRIYPSKFSDDELDNFYSEARCGLFHTGMVRGAILINSNYEEAILFEDLNDIKVNPHILLRDIIDDFNSYLSDLRNTENVDLRNRFDNMFNNL